MIYISLQERAGIARIGLQEISGAIDSPKAFTAKVLQQLTRSKLLRSVPGPGGGFSLPDRQNITLAEIVTAIDGSALLQGCVLGFEQCSSQHPCPVHYKFVGIRDYLNGTLNATTLDELNQLFDDGRVYLKE